MPDTPEQLQWSQFTRHENFESWYSNNVQMHPSEWDIKFAFGELDYPEGKMIVQQHTAVSMSWLQAKLMHYYLSVQLGLFEMSHGKIPVPAAVFPAEPMPPTGDFENDAFAKQAYEYLFKMREEFRAKA